MSCHVMCYVMSLYGLCYGCDIYLKKHVHVFLKVGEACYRGILAMDAMLKRVKCHIEGGGAN